MEQKKEIYDHNHSYEHTHLNTEQKKCLRDAELETGTWVSFHGNNIIATSQKEQEVLKATAEYFKNINVKPEKLNIFPVGRPMPDVHIDSVKDESSPSNIPSI